MRLISASGEQLGIKHIREAMDIAERQDLDLVEVAPNANPPVVRLMDYGKYKYQKEQARKAARKKQVNINVREIKLRPKIGDHDFETKKGHVERFLRGGDKVKVTIMFRGREVQHPELGERLLRRLADDLSDLGRIENQPKLDGRNMVMVLAPARTWPRRRRSPGPPAGRRRPPAARHHFSGTMTGRLPSGPDEMRRRNGFVLPCREPPSHGRRQSRNGKETRMPKMKTHKGAAGRFEVMKRGRIKRRRAGHNHILEKKTSKRKRRLNTETFVNPADEKRVRRLLGVK